MEIAVEEQGESPPEIKSPKKRRLKDDKSNEHPPKKVRLSCKDFRKLLNTTEKTTGKYNFILMK